MIGGRVEVEARMLGLDGHEVGLADGLLEQLAHELELLGEPGGVLEAQLDGTRLDAEDVDVLAELVDGVYRVLDVEQELTQLVVDHAGHRLHLEYVRVVEANVEQVEIRLLVVLDGLEHVLLELAEEGDLNGEAHEQKLTRTKKYDRS